MYKWNERVVERKTEYKPGVNYKKIEKQVYMTIGTYGVTVIAIENEHGTDLHFTLH